MHILFLGDSNSCCELETNHQHRWPLQLAAKAAGRELETLDIVCHHLEDGEHGNHWLSDFSLLDKSNHTIVTKVTIIAKTGKRSDELYSTMLEQKEIQLSSEYDAVIILVGVNDQFQKAQFGLPCFEESLKNIVTLATSMRKKTAPIAMLAIPDWGTAPAGADPSIHAYRCGKYKLDISTKESIAKEIEMYNGVVKKVTDEMVANNQSSIFYIAEINKISREYGLYPGMTQADGLHYTWEMTQKWNHCIFSTIPILEIESLALTPFRVNSVGMGNTY